MIEVNESLKNYKETTDPNEILKIIGLDACVGLCLAEDLEDIRKRARSWITYYGAVDYDKTARLKIEDMKLASAALEDIIMKFRNLRKFPEKLENPENIKAYVVGNRTKVEEARETPNSGDPYYELAYEFLKRELKFSDDINYVNCMFDFVIGWLTNKGINPISDGILEWRTEGNPLSKKPHHITSKTIALHNDKINIIYKDKNGAWLNSETYSRSL